MNKQITHYPYYVVSAENFVSLQKEVFDLAVEGFRPLGGIAITNENDKTMLHQAMWSDWAMETYGEYHRKRFSLPPHPAQRMLEKTIAQARHPKKT